MLGNLGRTGRCELSIASISVMNALYSLRKRGYPMTIVKERFNMLLLHLEVVNTGNAELRAGLNAGWPDTEDATQFHSAMSAGAIHAIVSNDTDFKPQKLVPVLTPAHAFNHVT